jgi:hypothetical protein
MSTIDRVAVILRLKKPCLDWAKKLASTDRNVGKLEALRKEAPIYLLPCADRDDPEDVLENHFAEIFRAELQSWTAQEILWPKGRDFDLFKTWYDAEILTTIIDFGRDFDGEVEDEPAEEVPDEELPDEEAETEKEEEEEEEGRER